MPDPFWFKAGSGIVRSIGYTAAAPLAVELLPAGHAAGFYLLNTAVAVRTAAGAGTLVRAYGFSTPTVGATVMTFGSITLTAAGTAVAITSAPIYSDGVSAVTATLTPAGVTGSPVYDVTSAALFIGA